jgi:uncharacterized protein (DUF302 family)
VTEQELVKVFKRWILLFALLVLPMVPAAEEPGVYLVQTEAGLDETYKAVYAALEDARFWVVFEADMGTQMARFADKWGEDYNRSALDGIRTMVICNAWWANRVANADPEMLAFCPLRVALTRKAGVTRVMFARPTLMAARSPALPVMQEIENELRAAVDAGVAAVAKP